MANDGVKINADEPLTVNVVDGLLMLRIGVGVLARSFEESEENNPDDEEAEDCATYTQTLFVSDQEQFAKDVIQEMEDEGEDGSSPLTRFLDEMCEAAVGNGSLAVEEVAGGD